MPPITNVSCGTFKAAAATATCVGEGEGVSKGNKLMAIDASEATLSAKTAPAVAFLVDGGVEVGVEATVSVGVGVFADVGVLTEVGVLTGKEVGVGSGIDVGVGLATAVIEMLAKAQGVDSLVHQVTVLPVSV